MDWCAASWFFGLCLFASAPLACSLPVALESRGHGTNIPLRDSALSGVGLVTGLSSFLVLYATIGRALGDPLLITACALAGNSAFAIWILRRAPAPARAVPWGAVLGSYFALALLTALLFWGRLPFTAIDYDPGRFGAEKLYNFTFVQAFVHGSGYPPENLWLAGERIHYYILPKTLPGVASHFALRFNGDVAAPGFLFHLSDAFFIAAGLFGIAKVALAWLSEFPAPRPLLLRASAALLGAWPLLHTCFSATLQAAAGKPDLWSLSRIMDPVISEYPFWNYIWADAHAHSAITFLQVGFVFWLVTVLRDVERAPHQHLVLLALSAVAVFLSENWSVLVDVMAFTPLALLSFALATERRAWIARLLPVALIALLLTLAEATTKSQAAVKWYYVPGAAATSLKHFLDIHFGQLLFLCAAFATALLGRPNRGSVPCGREEPRPALPTNRRYICHAAAGAAICAALATGRPMLAIAGAFALASWILGSGGKPERTFMGCVLPCAFLCWAIPELVAVNFDMGEKYMRYNMIFRFGYSSFSLLPLGVAATLGPRLARWAAGATPGRIAAIAAPLAAGVALLSWANAATYRNRDARTAMRGGWGGLDFLAADRPQDWLLIDALRRMPGRIVLIEECGIQPKAGGYTVFGRISAYSGHPALCGWAHHVFLFHKKMDAGPARGQGAFGHLLERDRWTKILLESITATPEEVQALAAVQAQGATHLVLGQVERDAHPAASLQSLAWMGKVVFENGGFGIVELGKSPSSR